jgi:hypothetical protein
VRPDAIEAFVDLTGLGAGKYNLRVQFTPSTQFGVTEFSPADVTVTLRATR